MLHGLDCPHPSCSKKVADWFIEWYPRLKQYEIGKQQLAMDCPWCRRAVIWRKGILLVAPPGIPVEVRSYEQATRYATDQPEGYPSLEAFLADPKQAARAEPFKRGYWLNVNVP